MFTCYYDVVGEFHCIEKFSSESAAIAFAKARLVQGCWDRIAVYDENGACLWRF